MGSMPYAMIASLANNDTWLSLFEDYSKWQKVTQYFL